MNTYQQHIKKLASTIDVISSRIGVTVAVSSLSLVGVSNAAESMHDYANVAFSNVRFIKTENDLVGWRIQIVSSSNQTYVLVQSFEGTPQVPCLTKAKVDAIGAIQFNLPPTCETQGQFAGKIQKNGLVGRFLNGMKGPDGEAVMTLKRMSIK